MQIIFISFSSRVEYKKENSNTLKVIIKKIIYAVLEFLICRVYNISFKKIYFNKKQDKKISPQASILKQFSAWVVLYQFA